VEVYPLLEIKEMTNLAKYNKEKGVLRYSIVTSGRKLNDGELDYMCTATKDILGNFDVKVCASFGLLDEEGFAKKVSIRDIEKNDFSLNIPLYVQVTMEETKEQDTRSVQECYDDWFVSSLALRDCYNNLNVLLKDDNEGNTIPF